MAACGGGERAGRLVDEEDEAVVGGEGGGVVFLRQLPEVGDAVAEGSDGAGGLGHVGASSGGGEGRAYLGVVDDVFTAGRAVLYYRVFVLPV